MYRKEFNERDKELLSIWNSLKKIPFGSNDMYDETTTMDEYAMCIYGEMGERNLSTE